MRPIPRSSFLIVALILLVAAGAWVLVNGMPGQSVVGLEVVINYADGTSQTVQGTPMIPHAVAVAGGSTPINSITFNVKATPSWAMATPASISGVSWAGSIGSIKVDGAAKQSIALAASAPSSITNGQTYTVMTQTISGSTLNSWIPFDYANHNLVCDVAVQLAFTPPNDQPKTISGAKTATLSLKNIGFPALLTVTIDNTVS